MRIQLSTTICCLLTWACADVPATNPHDPATPRSQQASARLSGSVALPDSFDRAVLQAAAVHLIDLAAPAQAAGTAPVEPDGSFAFPNVSPGQYTVAPRLEGFTAAAVTVSLGLGQTLTLATIELRPADGAAGGQIEGDVQLHGQPEDHHGGVRVEAIGTPYWDLTRDDGTFTLPVPAGRYDLSFSRRGYAAGAVTNVRVDTGATTRLSAVVELASNPGRILGKVVLPDGFGDGERLQRLAITCYDDDDQPLRHANPEVDGRFEVSEVPSGLWRMAFDGAGFEPIDIRVVVDPGARVDLGTVRMVLGADGERLGAIEGVARRLGEQADDAHGGVAVGAEGTPFAATTTPEGRFRLSVTPGRHDLRFRANGYHEGRARSVGPVVAGETFALAEEVLLATQAGAIEGTVALPDGFGADGRLERVRVRRWRANAPDGAPADGEAEVSHEGRFELSEVVPGDWRVVADLGGFLPDQGFVRVGPGERASAGTLRLAAVANDDPTRLATVRGQARRQGASEAAHGGILVHAVGTPFATVTTPDGAYQLLVTPEPQTLRFQAEGHGTQDLRVDGLVGGVTHVVDDAVLAAHPGRVHGRVALARFGSPARLQAVDVRLLADDQPRNNVSPDAEGAYALPDIAPGAYEVELTASGYEAVRLRIEVAPGATVDLGRVALLHQSDGDEAVPLAGRVRLRGAEDHGGTLVRARLVDGDRPYREALTDADGRFAMPASAEERYRVMPARRGFGELAGDDRPVAWRDDAFRDDGGAPIDIELAPARIDGEIVTTVTFAEGLDWLPDDALRARVTVTGPNGFVGAVDEVAHGTEARIGADEAGSYVVRVQRVGFTAFEERVSLDDASPEAAVVADALELVDLAAAGIDLAGRPIAAADLPAGVNLSGARLAGATLTGDFGGRDLSGANLANTDLTEARLAGANLTGANLFGASASGANLRGAELYGASLFGARLADADLVGADLRFADLTSADLRRARFVAGEEEDETGRFIPAEPQPAPPCADNAERPAVRLDGAIFSQAELGGAKLAGARLPRVNLSGARLERIELSSACLRDAVLTAADLTDARLDRADLRGARLINAVLAGTSLRGADLHGANLASAILERTELGCLQVEGGACACPRPITDFDGPGACADPEGEAWATNCACRTRLADSNLNGANLVGADLAGADLAGSTFIGADFGDALTPPVHLPHDCPLPPGCAWGDPCVPDIRECQRRPTRLRGARLDSAEMSGVTVEHVDLRDASMRGAHAPNAAFTRTALTRVDLTGSNLDRAVLSGLDLRGADLSGADLRKADLSESVLAGGRLEGANLSEADLRDTDLTGADLSDADFTDAALDVVSSWASASLRGVNLEGRDLSDIAFPGVDFAFATLDQALLGGTDLSGATFHAASLVEVDFASGGAPAQIAGADFSWAHLDHTSLDALALERNSFRGASLRWSSVMPQAASEVDFTEASLVGARFGRSEATENAGPILYDVPVDGADFSGAGLRSVRLGNGDGVRFRRVAFHDVSLHGRFSAADFTEACFDERSSLHALDLSGATLVKAQLLTTSFREMNLRGADLTDAVLSTTNANGERDPDMRGVVLEQATLVRVDLRGKDLREYGFAGADLRGAKLEDADLSGVDLSGARLGCVDEEEGPAAFAQRFDRCLAWRLEHPCGAPRPSVQRTCSGLHQANLSGANLRGADVSGASLNRANLADADLDEADIRGAKFYGATLSGVDMPSLDITGAGFGGDEEGIPDGFFRDRDLPGVQLGSVDLSGADFRGRDLRGADLSAANLAGARFDDQTQVAAIRLRGQQLLQVGLHGRDLTNAYLGFDGLNGPDLDAVDLTGATLTGVYFTGSLQPLDLAGRDDLMQTRFPSSHSLPGGGLGGANLTGADLSGTRIPPDYDFREATLGGVSFSGAELLGALDLSALDLSCANLRFSPAGSSDLTRVSLEGGRLVGVNLDGAELGERDWSAEDLSYARLDRSNVSGVDLTGTTLRYASLRELDLQGRRFGGDLTGVDFSGSTLQGVEFAGATVTGANFRNTGLADQDFAAENLTCVNLQGTDIATIRLRDRQHGAATMEGANFAGLDLGDKDLSDMNLAGANLSGADVSHVALGGTILRSARIRPDVDESSAPPGWLRRLEAGLVNRAHCHDFQEVYDPEPFTRVDLRHHDLTGTRLDGTEDHRTELLGVDLRGQHLADHDLRNVDFSYSLLRGATLPRDLTGARFSEVDLRRRDFSGSDLTGTDFEAAWLDGADLRGATLDSARFQDASLHQARLCASDRDIVTAPWRGEPIWDDGC